MDRSGRRGTIRVATSAALLGTFSLVFAFLAYATKIKVEDVKISRDGICIYPNSAAFGLGIVAAVLLLTEQIVISSGTGCFCCGGSRCRATCGAITAMVLFVLSWLTFVIAFTGLIASAILNSDHFLMNFYNGTRRDNKVKCGDITNSYNSFIGAAIWSLISIVLGLISYVIFTRSASNQKIEMVRDGNNPANEQVIAMGQPSTQVK